MLDEASDLNVYVSHMIKSISMIKKLFYGDFILFIYIKSEFSDVFMTAGNIY